MQVNEDLLSKLLCAQHLASFYICVIYNISKNVGDRNYY